MKRLRTVIFWCHLVTGLTIGSIVLVMSATGVLLAWQRQMQAWADTRGLDTPPPASGVAPLPPEQLIARVQQVQSGMITGVRWRNDADAPVEMDLGREATLFVDPYTGTVLGDGSERTRAFFRTITAAHRWLALPEDHLAAGRAITGAANIAFLFMVCSGFYLWWPRTLTARAFSGALMFRRGLRPKARDFNWHRVIGFWSFVPLVIIIASAAVTSYGWAGALIERIATNAGTVPNARQPARAGPPASAGRAAPATSANAARTAAIQAASEAGRATPTTADLVALARERMPGWRSITMQLPAHSERITFIIDGGTGGQPHRVTRLVLDESSGTVSAWEPFSSGSRAGRLRSLLRYAHTGEVAGVAGQTLAGLVSAGTVLLVWTGISLALRRFAAWRRRRNALADA